MELREATEKIEGERLTHGDVWNEVTVHDIHMLFHERDEFNGLL